MTSPKSEVRPGTAFADVAEMYRRVESAIKAVESVCGKIPTPALNEIRMAFYHVIYAAEDGNFDNDFEAALKHCKRAYCDAREIEILAALKIIADFDTSCSGHEDVVAKNICGYAEKRKAAMEAKAAISESTMNHTSRDQHYNRCDPYCKTLRDYCKEISSMRLAISTAIRKERIAFLFKLIFALSALATIIGVALNLFCKH